MTYVNQLLERQVDASSAASSLLANMIAPLVILVLLVISIAIVARGTATKNRLGVNLGPVSCPRCSTPFPTLRIPKSLRQARWGGWTCPTCGVEVDKWGREIH
jgi:hypothetical protein